MTNSEARLLRLERMLEAIAVKMDVAMPELDEHDKEVAAGKRLAEERRPAHVPPAWRAE